MATFKTKSFIKYDDYMTPSYAWQWIKDYIPKNKTVWEAFYGDGQSGKDLEALGFHVIHKPVDFFSHDMGDVIVSNIPFSKKKEVFTRLNKLGKPFIIICPSSMINTQYIRHLFKNDYLQIMIPPKRINFIKKVNGCTPDGFGERCNFDCFFYCWKLGLPSDIIWLEE